MRRLITFLAKLYITRSQKKCIAQNLGMASPKKVMPGGSPTATSSPHAKCTPPLSPGALTATLASAIDARKLASVGPRPPPKAEAGGAGGQDAGGRSSHLEDKQQKSRHSDISSGKHDLLAPGDVLDDLHIMSKLGQGGFGQVFLAQDNENRKVAVKVEPAERGDPRKRMEWNVLLLLQKKPHCPIIYKCGMTELYSFMTMQLLGRSLSAIRRKCMFEQRRLSLNATFRVTAQCVLAIRDLHKIGFLHRDIKPSNFAIGVDKQSERLIYMLDYGLCRGYVAEDNKLRPERAKGTVGFRGTARYASLAAHRGDDLSRRDDLWSLFYTFIELLAGILPWRSSNDKDIVYAMKKQFTPEIFCRAMMPEVKEFVALINKLSFVDEPNYEKCSELFEKAVDKLGFKKDDPYDWQLNECQSLPHWKPPPIP